MRPERQGYQPPILDNDQSGSTLNFSSSRPPFGPSRTFAQVAQTLNLGAQNAEWIHVPRSTRGANTEWSEAEPTETPRSTMNARTERSEPELIRHPSLTLATNQRRSEFLPIDSSSFTLSADERRNESERTQTPRPNQIANTERSESQRIHGSRPIQASNQRRSESLPIYTSIFILGANERRNESGRARFLDPRLDRLGQRSQQAVQGNQESCCDVFKELSCCMECISACYTERHDKRESSDIIALQVLFLISLQLLVITVLTMVCLRNDDKADSIVNSHKWLLGLSFPMCFSVLIARTCCKEGCQILPVSIIMFLIWSAGVVLTISWITVLLSFNFLSLLIFFLLLWTASILVSGVICAQPLLSYCSVLMPLCVIGTAIALFITVGSKSIISVSFASFISLLILLYLVWRLVYLIKDGSDWSEQIAFYIATCIMF